MRLLLLLLAAVAAVLAHATVVQARDAPLCTGSRLEGTFELVPGSQGAGSVVYALRLENRSARRCSVVGVPSVQVMGRTGAFLRTVVRASRPSALTPRIVTLGPARAVVAEARFSPDVPGRGEPRLADGQCEPTAYRLRVAAPGGGTVVVPLRPPTPVCEHGSLQFSAYATT
jgi:hypothetical protein